MQTARSLLLFTLLVAALGVHAQPAPPAVGAPVVRDATTRDAANQRIEHIEVEDSGSRIDELRVGGETKSITVQPKANVPPYNVAPPDMTRPDNRSDNPSGAGRRTWKVLDF